MEIKDFESMIGDRLRDVILKPYNSQGEIKLFGEFTHVLAREQYEHVIRHNPEYQPRPYTKGFDLAHQWVEHHAKLGAFVADRNKENSIVYELGCGIAIPSLAYALITGEKVIAIDKDPRNIEIVRRLANSINMSNIEFIVEEAENILAKRIVNSKDFFIISNPNDSLASYWKTLIEKHEINLVLSVYPNALLETYPFAFLFSSAMLETVITPSIEKYLRTLGYNTIEIGESKDWPSSLVILALK